MNINEAFPSKYLKAYELQGKTPTVTIARVTIEPMGRTRERTPVVYFVGKAKGMKLNKTNASAIQTIAGSALTEDWIGKTVQLYAAIATFGEKPFDVVRIRPVPGPTRRPTTPTRSMSQTSQTRRPVPVDETELDLMHAGVRS